MSVQNRFVAAVLAGGLFIPSTAFAHISAQGPAIAGKNHLVTFGVGHGCEGADTFRVEIRIPEEVTAVRALPSAWGEAELITNDAGLVTSVAWTKDEARPADDQYYQFAIRIAVPNAPFTRLYLPGIQTCRSAAGEELMAEWSASVEDAEAAAEGEEVLESPWLWVMPVRFPGWNKYTVPDAIDDLGIFDDAQIVWAGDAAYSSNPATVELIESEDDVEPLTEIAADTEIWVKY